MPKRVFSTFKTPGRQAGEPKTILTNKEIIMIHDLKGKLPQRTVAKMFNTTQANVSLIQAEKRHKHLWNSDTDQ